MFSTIFVIEIIVTAAGAAQYGHNLYHKTYRISFDADIQTAAEASTTCKSEVANLADIQTDEELKHIVSAIRQQLSERTANRKDAPEVQAANQSSKTTNHQPQLYIIDGTFNPQRGHWEFANRNRIIYANWSSGQPTNSLASSCVALSAANGEWHEVSCNAHPAYYICTRKDKRDPIFTGIYYGQTYFVPLLEENKVRGPMSARRVCEAKRASLVAIHSREELQHLKTLMYSVSYNNKVWLRKYAIDGKLHRPGPGWWTFKDAKKMSFVNWAKSSSNGDCIYLDPNYPENDDSHVITNRDAKNYFRIPCNSQESIYYICSRSAEIYLKAQSDYIEGVTATWTCVSYLRNIAENLQFVETKGTNTTTRTVKSSNRYVIQTGVTETKVQYQYKPSRKDNGISVHCQTHTPHSEPHKSNDYTLNVIFPPTRINISKELSQMIEGITSTITITSDESYPASKIRILAGPNISSVQSRTIHANGNTYPSNISITSISVMPSRADNKKNLVVQLTNTKFPHLNITRNVPMNVFFPPSNIQISVLTQAWEGISHSIIVSSDNSNPEPNITVQCTIGHKFTVDRINSTSRHVHFIPRRQDNGKQFTAFIANNTLFPTLNIAKTERLSVYFSPENLSLYFDKEYYRNEDDYINVTCSDSGAHPSSTVQFFGLDDTTSERNISGPMVKAGDTEYDSIVTSRTIRIKPKRGIRVINVICKATHMAATKKQSQKTKSREIRLVYLNITHSTSPLVITKPGTTIEIAAIGYPADIMYQITPQSNRNAVSSTRLPTHINALTGTVSVQIPTHLIGGKYVITLSNRYNQTAAIEAVYSSTLATDGSAASALLSNPVVIIGGASIAAVLLLVCAVVLVLVALRRSNRGRPGPPSRAARQCENPLSSSIVNGMSLPIGDNHCSDGTLPSPTTLQSSVGGVGSRCDGDRGTMIRAYAESVAALFNSVRPRTVGRETPCAQASPMTPIGAAINSTINSMNHEENSHYNNNAYNLLVSGSDTGAGSNEYLTPNAVNLYMEATGNDEATAPPQGYVTADDNHPTNGNRQLESFQSVY